MVRRVWLGILTGGAGVVTLLLIPAAWQMFFVPEPSTVQVVPAVVVSAPSGSPLPSAASASAGASKSPTGSSSSPTAPTAKPTSTPHSSQQSQADSDGDDDDAPVVINPNRVRTLTPSVPWRQDDDRSDHESKTKGEKYRPGDDFENEDEDD